MTAPAVRPEINCLDDIANRMSKGIVAIAEPAINAPHSVLTGLCKLRSAKGSVNISGDRITIKGPIKLFQDAIKVTKPKVPIAGLSRGSTIRA